METSKDYVFHESRAEDVAARARDLYERKQAFRLFHGSTNSARTAHQGRCVVDTSCLDRILKIDPQAKTAMVEPNVPMDKLVEATLQDGLMPAVVMEFPGITVGGGCAGSAGASSSHEEGYFSETVNWVDMVLADGEVVRASKSQHEDLFPRRCKGRSIEELVESACESRESLRSLRCFNDYIDGIVYSRNSGVVMTGVLTDEKPPSVGAQTFSRPFDPSFYKHVQRRIQNPPQDGSEMIDYIPNRDYLFRFGRGGLWPGRESSTYSGFAPFNGLTNWFLNDILHARTLSRALPGANKYLGLLRKKYRATKLPSIYEKDHADDSNLYAVQSWSQWLLAQWPLAGVAGIVAKVYHRQPLWRILWELGRQKKLD
ncbi:fad binding domain-containing protein [Apiospora phragmitis]|uniref:Delta(24)-sterol reductase n=1 Tax=Apiospora phragmitis TaxID=2905665 RepID=A0ABR1VPP3_9PEZI